MPALRTLTVVRAGRPHRYRELALERLDLHLLLLPLPSLGLGCHLAEDRVVGRAEASAAALARLLSGLARRSGAGLDINVVVRHRDLVVHADRVRANYLLLRLQYDFLAARLRQRLQRYHRLPVLALDRRLHGLARYLHWYRLYLDLLDVWLNLHFGYYVRGRHINLRRRRHVNVPKWLAWRHGPRRGLERPRAHVTPAAHVTRQGARRRASSRRHLGSATRRSGSFHFPFFSSCYFTRVLSTGAIRESFHRSPIRNSMLTAT